MYDAILLPTDGSKRSAPVVEQTIQLANLCAATVHVIHVVDERSYLSIPDDARDHVRETLEADGDAFTKDVAEKGLAAGLEVVRELRWGDPTASILAYATENEVDLIVMGTHGRTGYERYLLGSVTERVVRLAPMPVLAIAVGDTEAQRESILSAPLLDHTPEPGEGTTETELDVVDDKSESPEK